MSTLEVTEGIQFQNRGESIAYVINVANWTSAPSSPSVTEIVNHSNGQDVKSTLMPAGSATVSSTTITLPILLKDTMRQGTTYSVFFDWVDGSETKEAVIRVRCPKRSE